MNMEVIRTVWVCQCYMLVHANGECCEEVHETWAELGEREVATMGLLTEEHACRIDVTSLGQKPGTEFVRGEEDCDCERREFSWSACEGCGNPDGGTRYGFTLWRELH